MIFFNKGIFDSINIRKAAVVAAFLIAFSCHSAKGQDTEFDSLLNVTLAQDSLFLEELLSDTTFSILDLIDSLIAIDPNFSSLSLRLSYTSNIAYAGRDFGFQQHGGGGGLTYYHKSGVFGDVSGFWNSEITPRYNPTVATIGYLGAIGKKWSYILDYDHYFYQKPESDEFRTSYPLTNSLNGSLFYDFRFLSPGVDYSFMFGQETAHRIRGNIISRIKFRDVWIFDRISISPGVSVLAGNQNLYSFSQNYQLNKEEFFMAMIEKYGFLYLRWLRLNRPLLYRELLETESENYTDIVTEESSENAFGIMNYAVSLPIYFNINKFSLAISYHLNFPVALPGETTAYDPNSYFGVSLLYNLIFK